MNCTDVTTIMDEHADARLTTAERCALDEHLAGCEPCTQAWHAQTALLALRIPETRPSLLADVLRAVTAPGARGEPTTRQRRARTVLSAAVLAAGAALVAAAVVTAVQRARDDSADASPATAAPGGPAATASTEPGASSADTTVRAAGAEPADYVDIDVDLIPVVRTPPDYPPAALERKLEGWVQLNFTIAANGAVEDVTVVDSDEPLFEPAAVRALSSWKYLPRVVAGKRVAAHDVQTIIRFAMAPDPPPNAAKSDKPPPGQIPQPSEDPRADARFAAYAGVQRGIATAWERVAVEDLRGAELALDELRATYELDARQQAGLWDFYAYIYTQYRDYGRAIAAYQSSIAINETLPGGLGGQRLALAKLYFARHQYDLALKTVLPYQKKNAGKVRYPGADEFIEKLRALGVTEETL